MIPTRTSLGRLESCQLRFELEAQLGAFIIRQPERHLWHNGTVKRKPRRLPGERLRCPRLGKNFVQSRPHFVRIWPIRGNGFRTKKIGLRVCFEKVRFAGASHKLTMIFDTNQGALCDRRPASARAAVHLSPLRKS
jgi:hypothetical protein